MLVNAIGYTDTQRPNAIIETTRQNRTLYLSGIEAMLWILIAKAQAYINGLPFQSQSNGCLCPTELFKACQRLRSFYYLRTLLN